MTTIIASALLAPALPAASAANMGISQDEVSPLKRENVPDRHIFAPEGENPDADLVRLCAEHVVNLRACNADRSALDEDESPFWRAYEATRDAIAAARPQSLVGMVAKARVAKVEALEVDGEERPAHCPAADWAWDLVGDLLRLHGGGSEMPPLPSKPHNDMILVDLEWQLRAAIQEEEAAWIRCSRAMGQPQEAQLEEDATAATDKRETILDRIAETPAASPLGFATKSLIVSAAANGHGMTDAEHAVADSLLADARRLIPGL